MKVLFDVEGHMTRVWSADALRWKVGVKDPKNPELLRFMLHLQ